MADYVIDHIFPEEYASLSAAGCKSICVAVLLTLCCFPSIGFWVFLYTANYLAYLISSDVHLYFYFLAFQEALYIMFVHFAYVFCLFVHFLPFGNMCWLQASSILLWSWPFVVDGTNVTGWRVQNVSYYFYQWLHYSLTCQLFWVDRSLGHKVDVQFGGQSLTTGGCLLTVVGLHLLSLK